MSAPTLLAASVTPAAAASALLAKMAAPSLYAAAIVERGRDYVTAVCAAITIKTEADPEMRRHAYRMLHQACTRASAPFAVQSRKHSGLSVVDAKPAESSSDDTSGPTAQDTPKPSGKARNVETVDYLTAKLRAAETEIAALRTTLAERDETIAQLRQSARPKPANPTKSARKPNLPAGRPVMPAAPAASIGVSVTA